MVKARGGEKRESLVNEGLKTANDRFSQASVALLLHFRLDYALSSYQFVAHDDYDYVENRKTSLIDSKISIRWQNHFSSKLHERFN